MVIIASSATLPLNINIPPWAPPTGTGAAGVGVGVGVDFGLAGGFGGLLVPIILPEEYLEVDVFLRLDQPLDLFK